MSTGQRQVTASTNGLGWRRADDGFWVGADAGMFAGSIDQSGAHFYARNQFGEYIGDFADLHHAQAALEACVQAAAQERLRVA